FAVDPRAINVAGAGVTGSSISITSSAPDCQRSTTASVPWILVSAGNSGAGSGVVTYTVGINTGGLRTGAITVAGRTVYINQAGVGGTTTSLASITNGGV